jgi:hypothetical protein
MSSRASVRFRRLFTSLDFIGLFPLLSHGCRAAMFAHVGSVSQFGRRSARYANGNWPARIATSGLVFSAADGSVESHVNVTRQVLVPVLRAVNMMVPALGKDGMPKKTASGKPMLVGKYGWHSLRPFYASWCINRKVDGGLELPAKMVQQRMGHTSIAITMDVYGHLFPRGDDEAELAAAERALLA